MKLQKLTIRNLASIEDAVIDFEHGPLGEESLFLICGETGAGKTTILVSICLALYNETPRMDRAENERYKDAAQTASGKKEDIAINDNRQLMRRNTGEAWSELEFTGSNDIPYTARWYVARAHRKVSGSLQSVKWTLENRKTGIQLTKIAEIKAEIQKAVGLSFEQFCRTTLLAQGDFTKFLQSKESEKSDILEKLTGTGIYSRIGAEIYAASKQRRLAYETQKQKLNGIRLLTEEEKETLRTSIRQNLQEATDCKKQLDTVTQKRNWLQRNKELKEARQQRQQEWETSLAALKTDEYRQREQTLRDWNLSAEARNQLQTFNHLTTQQMELEKETSRMEAQYHILCQGVAGLREQLNDLQEKQQQTSGFLKEKAEYAPMFEESQGILADLKNLMEAERKEQEYRQQVITWTAAIPQLEKSLLSKEKDLQEKNQASAALQKEIDQQTKSWEAFNTPRLQLQKSDLEKRKEGLVSLLNELTLLREKQINLNTLQETEQKIFNQLITVQQEQENLQTTFNQAKQRYEETDALYRKQKEATEDWAREARARLVAGDHCPVCGQKITDIPHDEAFQSLLQPIYEELKFRQKNYDEAGQSLKANLSLQKQLTEQQQASHKNTENFKQGYQTTRRQVQDLCTLLGIRPQPGIEATQALIRQTTEDADQEIKSLSLQLEKADNLLQNIQQLQKQKDQMQELGNEAQRAFIQAEKELNDRKNQIQTGTSWIENEKNNIRTLHLRITEKMKWNDWNESWKQDPDSLVRKLKDETTGYRQAQEQLKAVTSRIELEQKELEAVLSAQETLLTLFPEWESDEKIIPQRQDSLGKNWNRLCTQASGIRHQQHSNATERKKAENFLLDFYRLHPDLNEGRLRELASQSLQQMETFQNDLQKLRNTEIEKRTAMELAVRELEQHQKVRPDLEEADQPESLAERQQKLDQQIAAANQSVGLLQAQLEQDQKNAENMQKEQQQADLLYGEFVKWDRLCRLFGDEKGKNFRNIAQSFVLKELLNGANFYLRKLTDRYELTCQPGSLTILLHDLYQGGATRPACTLSGGESFLVSLSLALGLSSLNQQSLSVDILFIDEGFGTLSEDYLNVVMDTLERLHQMGGKKVGIISHVEGLRERIKTQIQVRRIDNSRSEILTVSLV